jgi:DNA polymerase-3 subunit epsilon
VSSRAPFVAFDIETTGLFAGADRIAELGAVLFQGEEIIDEYQQLVDPEIPMPEEAGRVNGITDEMLKGQPTVAAVLPGFLAFLGRGTPVAHNAKFDVGFLCADIVSAGFKAPAGLVLDTRCLAKRAFPGRFSYSLVNLAKDFHLSVKDAHRALADAHACRLLFQLCAGAFGKAKSLAELVCLSGMPLDFTTHAPQHAHTAALLKRALREGASVAISYRSARGEITERTIEPLSFSTIGGCLAVNAYCTLRGSERTFRLDAILEVREAP